jgi:hypothetical protein
MQNVDEIDTLMLFYIQPQKNVKSKIQKHKTRMFQVHTILSYFFFNKFEASKVNLC